MANIAEGLSQKPEEDVNSHAGFEAAMARKGVEPEAGESSTDTSIASGLTTVEPGGQARDEDTGRFAAAPAAEDKPADTSTPAGEEPVVEEDPEVKAFLAKYGDDPQKALKAAVELQSTLGRQGSELGTLREQIAELRGMVAATQQPAAAPAIMTDDQIEEQSSALIQSRGWQDAATAAANHEHATGDGRLYRSIFEQWNLEDPFSAQTHLADFRAWQREQSRPQAAAADPWVEGMKAQTSVEGTLEALSKEVGPEIWAHIAPKMIEALETMPKNVGEMIASNDPEARLEGARLVADRAARMAGPMAAAPAAAATTTEEGVPASVARKLSGASVATGALRPAAAVPATEQSKEEAIAAFKKELLETETTNVASGLTYAK
jgi:hypothetical protein